MEAGPTLRGFQFLNTLLISTLVSVAARAGVVFFAFCADKLVIDKIDANTIDPRIDIRIVINLLILK
jgi:hypothetical protein